MIQIHITMINVSITFSKKNISEIIIISKEETKPRINRIHVINKFENDC